MRTHDILSRKQGFVTKFGPPLLAQPLAQTLGLVSAQDLLTLAPLSSASFNTTKSPLATHPSKCLTTELASSAYLLFVRQAGRQRLPDSRSLSAHVDIADLLLASRLCLEQLRPALVSLLRPRHRSQCSDSEAGLSKTLQLQSDLHIGPPAPRKAGPLFTIHSSKHDALLCAAWLPAICVLSSGHHTPDFLEPTEKCA